MDKLSSCDRSKLAGDLAVVDGARHTGDAPVRQAPDLIVLAETVLSMDPANEGVTAIGVTDGRISHLGTIIDTARWRGKDTVMHDFGAACITPGLIDSHMHPVSGAQMTEGAELQHAQSLEEVIALLRQYARTMPGDSWVQGWGLNPALFAGRPNGEFLDEAAFNRPAMVRMFDAHSAVLNREALRAADIDGPRAFNGRGHIDCDADGVPTGWLVEAEAIALVSSVVPRGSLQYRVDRLHRLLTDFARHGLTGAQVMEFTPECAELMAALEAGPGLPVQLRFYPWCDPGTTEAQWSVMAGKIGTGGNSWTVSGIKFFIDGTVENGTAWLSTPDVQGESLESYWRTPEHYTEAVRYFAEQGIPTATHAIGDAGVRHVLGSLAQLPPAAMETTHRIEHLETLTKELIEEAARSGLAASMQPTHCTHFVHADGSDSWSQRLGSARAGTAWRCRDVRDAGMTLALGSDWPVAPFDPRAIMADAQIRHRSDAPTSAPINPDQGLTALMALEGYTTHAARAAGLESELGSVTLGKQANLTVFAANPLQVMPTDLATTPVLATFVRGTAQYLS